MTECERETEGTGTLVRQQQRRQRHAQLLPEQFRVQDRRLYAHCR